MKQDLQSYFSLSKGKDKQFYFNLKAANHEIILQSEGYTTEKNAINGIHSVQSNSPHDENYERLIAKNKEPYFNLKAQNGEIIGTSETYSSNQAMENGIDSVKRNGCTTTVKGLEFKIYVNGREKDWNKTHISFKDVVILAFGKFTENARTCYTVTYTNGIPTKKEGSLVEGQEVEVNNKMIFNVSATDKS